VKNKKKKAKKSITRDQVSRLLLSLALGILLWYSVSGDDSHLVTQDINNVTVVMVNYEALEDQGLEIIDDRTYYVNIEVRGTNQNLNNISRDDIIATIDLSEITEPGDYNLEVVVSGIPNNVIINDTEPGYITLTVDEIVNTDESVVINTTGSVADGYTVMSADAEVETVSLEGPKNQVDQVAYVGGTVDVTGANTDFTQQCELKAYDEAGEIIESVIVTPDVVDATVVIGTTKSVPIEVDYTGEPADGYEVVSVSVNPTNKLIGGKSDRLSSVQNISTESLSIKGAESTVEFTDVELVMPDGISLIDETQTCVVTIVIEPLVEKDITITDFNITNLADGLTVSADITTDVVLTVEGLQQDIDELDASSLIAIVDLSKITEAGEYSMEYKVTLPDGITLVSKTPDEVEVVVEEEE
jgi:YbbR domain-containing protein